MDKVREETCEDKGLRHRQFLTRLQLEYLTHKLRSSIYRNGTYASVAADIAKKKRLKIIELSVKFNVDSIFTSKRISGERKVFQRFSTKTKNRGEFREIMTVGTFFTGIPKSCIKGR